MRIVLFISILFCFPAFGQEAITMKEYVDKQSELNRYWSERLMQAQFDNIKDNVDKANASMEKRLDGINEFRGQLKDQAGTFITRAELFAWIGMVIGLFFGFSRYMKDKAESSGKNIVSGDKVEVKK